MFYPDELDQIFCGTDQSFIPWDFKVLSESCKPAHGYGMDSDSITNQFSGMAGYDQDGQRAFHQFVTRCPRLPIGSFKSLTPPLTIVKKTFDTGTIDYPLTSPHRVRKKRVTSRETILKQGEQLMSELSSPGSLLEIQYEGEVGTGLGSTLEFYSLISKEMQRADLQLCKGVEAASHCVEYVHSDSGLNLPRARDCKSSHRTKIKNKFQFLTKFMAKVIVDLKVFSS